MNTAIDKCGHVLHLFIFLSNVFIQCSPTVRVGVRPNDFYDTFEYIFIKNKNNQSCIGNFY